MVWFDFLERRQVGQVFTLERCKDGMVHPLQRCKLRWYGFANLLPRAGWHKLWPAGQRLVRIFSLKFLRIFLVSKTEDCIFVARRLKTVVLVKKNLIYGIFIANVAKKHNRHTLRIKFGEHATNGEDKPLVWRPPLRSVKKQ